MKYFSNHLYCNVFMYLCTEEFKDVGVDVIFWVKQVHPHSLNTLFRCGMTGIVLNEIFQFRIYYAL